MPPFTIAVCALWVVSEFVLLVARHAGARASRRDRGSLILLVAGLTAAGYGASAARRLDATRIHGTWYVWAGIALILLGIAVRWMGILTLRRYFTVTVAIQQGHELVDHGIYSVIRHPAYAGSLISITGLGFEFRNWSSVAILVIVTLAVGAYRVAVEERALIEHFGDRYRDYARRTKRLIPGVY